MKLPPASVISQAERDVGGNHDQRIKDDRSYRVERQCHE